MLTEVLSFAGVLLLIFFLIRDKDPRYLFGFVLGFLMSMWVESQGVARGAWIWGNIIYPFNYMVLSVPIAVHLIYGSAGGLVFPLTKYVVDLREEEDFREKLDALVSYISIIIGISLVILCSRLGVGKTVGATFMMFGLYLLVNNPSVLYVGIIILSADFLIEFAMMFNSELSYAASYGDVGTGFFLVGVIIASIYLLTEENSRS